MKKDLYPNIDYTLSTVLKPEEPMDFLVSITGDVTVYSSDGPEEYAVIGKVHYYHAQLDQELRYPAWETVEGVTAETAAFACLFEEMTSNWTGKLQQLVPDADIGHLNLLILDRIQILPAYRGQGLSRALIKDALRTFAPSTQVLALKCGPLQLDDRDADRDTDPAFLKQMGWEQLPQDPETASARLEAYYKSLGFQRYNDDGVMVASRWDVDAELEALAEEEQEIQEAMGDKDSGQVH